MSSSDTFDRQATRRAARLSDFDLKDWREALMRVWQRQGEENLSLISAGVAFYGLLALFPGIAALVAMGGLFADGPGVIEQIEPVVSVLPEAAREIILGQVDEVSSSNEGRLGFAALIGLLIALYSASRGVGNLIIGLNVVNEENEERGFILLKLIAVGLTLFVAVMLIVALTVVAIIPAIVLYMSDTPFWESVAQAARWPILFVVGCFLFSVLYRYGPSRAQARWSWIAPGSILACILWVIGTIGFALYAQNFGAYNETFGTLGGVIVLLTWLWLSSFVFLIGAMVDAELEAQAVRDSTTGPSRPIGERGAVKADEAKGTLD